MTQINARFANPVWFGILFGVMYFLFRVLGSHAAPADALVDAFYAAALMVLAKLVLNRLKAARK